ncbi:MAG: response regulator [Deltaproteobacteria bacterium]|nr:response regulator [Deltaproteobacteria bacterium]
MTNGANTSILRAALDALPMAVLVMDRQGKPAFFNAAAAKILGRQVDPAVTKVASSTIPEHYKVYRAGTETLYPIEELGILRALRGETGWLTDMEIERAPGERILLDLYYAPVHENGEVAYALTVFRDVSAEKAMQARLALSDRLATIGTLAAGVAHEINNPLAFVVANVGYAIEEMATLGPVASHALSALDDARHGAERVRLIVRDLKMFSRFDDERVGAIDVRRPIESAITMGWNEIRHRARLVKDFEETPLVRGIEGKLAQVFLNLLLNAAQAIGEGAVDKNEIRVSVRATAADRVSIFVKDSGHGVPTAILPRIFEPFFTTKQKSGATGLGLAICRDIVTKLGGTIEVQSTPHKGTSFILDLPAETSQASTAGAGASVSARRGLILVVDDEPMVAAGVRRTLAQEQDVISFTSGKQALQWIAEGNRPAAVILDVMMPEMSGIEVFTELTRLAPELAPRTLFMSGGAFSASAIEFFAKIANTRLEKPFEPDTLRDVVRRLVQAGDHQ